jgi:hypothetical protein
MTRAELLEQYISEHAGRAASWGRSDCSMFVANWIERATGLEVPTPRYTGEEAGRAIIAAHPQGFEGVWRDIASSASIYETFAPELGDVAIINTSRYGPIGAIWGGHGYAYWRTLSGVTMVTPNPEMIVASWKVPNG